jgi:hydrogenase expression/formation protein HypE
MLHTLRDITRGGLATVLNEIAEGSRVGIELADLSFADNEVEGFCDILGLDPLYMGNEGKLAAVLPEREAEKALALIRASQYGESARIVGRVVNGAGVRMKTRSGGTRMIEPLFGEGLPRIC